MKRLEFLPQVYQSAQAMIDSTRATNYLHGSRVMKVNSFTAKDAKDAKDAKEGQEEVWLNRQQIVANIDRIGKNPQHFKVSLISLASFASLAVQDSKY